MEQIQPISEEYPSSFDKNVFAGLRSFAERVRYCTQHLQKIAAGSGRVVFKIDDRTALKLAKNPKGIAQNLQEAQIGVDHYFREIVAEVYNSDQDDKWVESELAKKLTPARFMALTGLDIKTVGDYLVNFEQDNRPKLHPYKSHFNIPNINDLHENPFLSIIAELIMAYNIRAFDLTVLSAYGEVNRGGHPTVIVVDYGLSDEVWQDHYQSSRMNRF